MEVCRKWSSVFDLRLKGWRVVSNVYGQLKLNTSYIGIKERAESAFLYFLLPLLPSGMLQKITGNKQKKRDEMSWMWIRLQLLPSLIENDWKNSNIVIIWENNKVTDLQKYQENEVQVTSGRVNL